jgi:hypothetical protein
MGHEGHSLDARCKERQQSRVDQRNPLMSVNYVVTSNHIHLLAQDMQRNTVEIR